MNSAAVQVQKPRNPTSFDRLVPRPFPPLLALLLVACATPGTLPPDTAVSADCRARYAEVDHRIESAGVLDPRFHRIPGYPYLRSDRFTASFAKESGEDRGTFAKWIQFLQDNDRNAREFELANLGLQDAERAALIRELHRCAQRMSELEIEDAGWRRKLIEAAAVPDDYSLAARTFGLYPLTLPFLKLGIGAYHRELRQDYAKPLVELETPGRLVLWNARIEEGGPPVSRGLDQAARDDLGRIELPARTWAALAQAHAPSWWIETAAGDYDQPGTPILNRGGPGLDIDRPVVYYQPGFTRFGGETLLQMSYLVWFRERPPTHAGDPYAGTLDGIVWRVTFDPGGRPLAYDTIHACGCYHYWFPLPGLVRRINESFWQEAALFPQVEVPGGRIALRVQSGTHYVRRVVDPVNVVAAETREYELRPYEDLLSMPSPEGARRSLFGPDGIVAGTERGERWWLWPSGVRNPGAMRVFGRHATAFVGRQHFDDPSLFDRLFVAPQRTDRP